MPTRSSSTGRLPRVGLTEELRRPTPADRLAWAAVALLAAGLFVVLVQHLGRLSLWMDEGFHYLAVKGILEHGLPVFPSGHMYWKAILYTYVLSGVSAVFGLNAVSLRIVSVLAAAGSLPAFYALARKLFNRWVGLAGVVLLALSPWLAEDGRAALYFAPVLLFVLLSLFFFYKGFFEEDRRSKVLATVFFLLTPLVHQLGMAVWFAFPALLVVRGLKRFLKKDVLSSFGLVTLFYLLIQLQEFFFWKVGYVYVKTDTSLRGMIDYFFSGFSLAYFREFFRSFPAMSLVVLGGFFFGLGMRLFRSRDADRETRHWADSWVFLALSLLFPLLFLGFFRTHIQPRYLFELYGLFILSYTVSLYSISRWAVDLVLPAPPRGPRGGPRNALVLVLFTGLLLGLTQNIGWGKVRAVVCRNYNDRIATDIIYRSGRPEQEDHRNPGLYVRRFLRPDDIVIAIHVVFGYIYAGRCEYWLWTGGPGTWDAWEQTPTGWRDFYVGARWINNLADLRRVIDDNPRRRVWLIASNSLLRRDHIKPEVRDFVQSNSDKLVFRGKDGRSAVYLWHEEPRRLTLTRHTLEAEWLPVIKAPIIYGDDMSKESGLLFRRGRGEAFRYDFEGEWPAGRYRMTWRAAAAGTDSPRPALILNLQTAGGAKLRSLNLAPGLFEAPGRWKDFSVDFSLRRESRLILRGSFTGAAGMRLDACDLTPLPEVR
jgi:hypothetical protein